MPHFRFKKNFYKSREFVLYSLVILFTCLYPPTHPVTTKVMPFVDVLFFLLIFVEKDEQDKK